MGWVPGRGRFETRPLRKIGQGMEEGDEDGRVGDAARTKKRDGDGEGGWVAGGLAWVLGVAATLIPTFFLKETFA